MLCSVFRSELIIPTYIYVKMRGDEMDKNILIADDNMEIIKILKPYIEKESFSFKWAFHYRK